MALLGPDGGDDMKRWRWGTLCLTLLSVLPFRVAAQLEVRLGATDAGAIFEGQVVDSVSGDPIPGVMVRMDVGPQTFTDALGQFRFDALPQGRRLFAILTADCRIRWDEITLVTGIPRNKRYRLPPAFGAAAAEEVEQSEARRRSGGGRRLVSEDIDRMNVRSVTELIRSIAPGVLTPQQGDPGNDSGLRSARGRSMTGETAPPVLVVDGVRMPGFEGVLVAIEPSEVAMLEVLPGAAAGWEYGSSGASGVIKITLRRGLPDGADPTLARAACVVPSFPGR
jgi:hypothetical protein